MIGVNDMIEKKELTCINCPMGCQLSVELEDGVVKSVTGNTCPRGDAYARTEVVNPVRTVTSTCIVEGGDKPRVSVKTASPIPKGKIDEVMKDINAVRAEAPVKIGDVLVKNTAGTGVDVIATRNIEKIA